MFWHVYLPVAMMALVAGAVIVKDWILDKSDPWEEIEDKNDDKEDEGGKGSNG